MHATSMSCLMDNFLAPRYISGKHLTFIDTDQFDIPSTGGLHQFNTWSDFSKGCTEQSSKCRLFTWPRLAWGQMNGIVSWDEWNVTQEKTKDGCLRLQLGTSVILDHRIIWINEYLYSQVIWLHHQVRINTSLFARGQDVSSAALNRKERETNQ